MADLENAVPMPKGVGGMFTRKYAGVPAWVILLVVAGAAFIYIRSRGSNYSLLSGTTSDSGGTDTLGSESAYDGSGTAGSVIYTIPAATTPQTDPNNSNHPAGQGGKKKAPKGWTGRGARGTGRGYHGHPPRKYPARH